MVLKLEQRFRTLSFQALHLRVPRAVPAAIFDDFFLSFFREIIEKIFFYEMFIGITGIHFVYFVKILLGLLPRTIKLFIQEVPLRHLFILLLPVIYFVFTSKIRHFFQQGLL